MQLFIRYWFIGPLFLLVVGLQLSIGFVTTDSPDNAVDIQASEVSFEGQEEPGNYQAASSLEASPVLAVTPVWRAVSPIPRGGAGALTTQSPTFTPSPTRTPTPTEVPTDTPLPPEPAAPTFTPTAMATDTPQPTPIEQGFSTQVPILMYHYISDPPPGSDAIRIDLSVPPAQFEAHLAYLRQAGYETITLTDLIYALSQQQALPPKPIILTFDDGYRDHYENAFPILRKYGYKGVFFVFTQPIDQNNVDYLSWDMVIEMDRAGMEFGSHSYRHPDLRNRDVDFLVYEILGSREALDERTQVPIRFFSYPSGHYDELTIRVVESANFWGAVTTQYGANQSYGDRFEMPRIRVRGNDTADDLAEKLYWIEQ